MMNNCINEPLTLYSLNNMVRAAVSNGVPYRYWVTGELSEVREASNGHCYIELVQRDEATNELVAKARGTVWARVYSLLRPYFLEQTGQPFAAGLKVLLQVTVGFHELYGYTLDVCDIEPAFTIGDIARQRRLIIERLTAEGVIDLNKQLPFPLLPQRVAVISSATAAGYDDFCDQLLGNRYGYVFYPHLFPAPMQGSRVEAGIIEALNRIAENMDMWDVVVIIRGGGATSELGCFDTYDLANNCAQFPLPIITGIGHRRDESLLDIVAHTSVKTPTAAAELLVQSMQERENELVKAMQDISAAVTQRVSAEQTWLHTLASRIPVDTAYYLKNEQLQLQSRTQRLQATVVQSLTEQRHRLDLCEKAVEAASPERILSLGYSITRVNGKAVRSAAEVAPGDEVTTYLAAGEFTSTVKKR